MTNPFTSTTALHSTAGSLFLMHLLSGEEDRTVAAHARAALYAAVTKRMLAFAHVLTPSDVDARPAMTIGERVEQALSLVLPALSACRTRSPQDFLRWLDARICDGLTGEPFDTPPSAPVRARGDVVTLSDLPIPRDEREKLLTEVLRRLPAQERRVLGYRAESRTWLVIAARMGISVYAAKALHRRALTHAQMAALDVLEERGEDENGVLWDLAA